MKGLLVTIVCLVFFSFFALAQHPLTVDLKKNDHLITCAVGVNSSLHYEARYEHFFQNQWSLLYTFGLSQNINNNYAEFRLPMGATVATGLVIGASACSLSGGIYWSDFEFYKLACLIPDGISYHQKIRGGFYFSPFINWSGISIRLNNETDQVDWIYTPKAGLRILKPLGKRGVISAEQTIQREVDNKIQLYPSFGLSLRF
jgi:hypothetical protein